MMRFFQRGNISVDEQWKLGTIFLSSGQVFGDYQIFEKLDEGCNDCYSFRAIHRPTGDEVALKVFHFSRPKARNLFETEVQSLQKIQGYSGIHPLRDFGEQAETYYIATNYLPEGCLRKLLPKYPDGMEVQEVLQLFSPIADAIDYCHSMGIVHRDLKPANILLDRTGQSLKLLLTDFGVARILDESRAYHTASFSGTLPYAAPETFDDEADKTCAIDIYSLGVILYEVLEGKTPFQDPNPIRLIDLHKNAPVPYPQNILRKSNPEFVQALLRAMAKNPIDRPRSAGRLLEDLRRTYSMAIDTQFWMGFGKQINDYTIERSMGVGRLSQTFLARNINTGQLVVVKLFSTGSTQPDAIRSFKDEITALKALVSPKGVLPLLDNGERNGMYYLVTQFMEDGSLRQYLETHPEGLEIKEVISLFSCIAHAIDSIHAQGIIHRDLKPENIVLGRKDGSLDPYLTDFGIARVLAGTQSFYTQNVTGTFRYMSPEAWDPGMKKTAAVDIYAFGIMLYEALEGKVPFNAEYPAIINQHVQGEIPQPERTLREYGPLAAKVVLRALAKKAGERPATAVEIMDELQRNIPGLEWLGERFGEYRLVSFLGASTVGQTFKAKDERTGDWVAIKIMPYTTPIHELEIYQKLDPQPGILALRDSGSQAGRYYLVTDFMDGGNLRQALDQKPEEPDIQAMLDLFGPIASALDKLHQLNIVHRDLKPENVVLRKTEHALQPYITDFGISRAVSQTQSFYTSTVAGTSYYTAPEAWTPGTKQTSAVDIYALGIMLYEALEGSLPFKAEYPAIGLQHLTAEVPYPKKLAAQAGPQAVKILLSALAKKAEERPTSAIDLVNRLCRAYEQFRIQMAKKKNKRFFAWPALSNRKRIAAGIGLILLAAFMTTVWAMGANLPPFLRNMATLTATATSTSLRLETSNTLMDTPSSAMTDIPSITASITGTSTATPTLPTLTSTSTPTRTGYVPSSTYTPARGSGQASVTATLVPTNRPPTNSPPTNSPPTNPPPTSVPATATKRIGKPATNTPKPKGPG
jgi:serine/threonine protein kinase